MPQVAVLGCLSGCAFVVWFRVCLCVIIAFVGCLFGCCGVVCVYLLVVVSLVCDSWFGCSLDFGLLIVGLMCLLVWYGWL